MLLNYFEYIFGHLRQKSKSQARIKPEIFVNFRPKPGPSPTRKARPDLQFCAPLNEFTFYVNYLSIALLFTPYFYKKCRFTVRLQSLHCADDAATKDQIQFARAKARFPLVFWIGQKMIQSIFWNINLGVGRLCVKNKTTNQLKH